MSEERNCGNCRHSMGGGPATYPVSTGEYIPSYAPSFGGQWLQRYEMSGRCRDCGDRIKESGWQPTPAVKPDGGKEGGE